MRYIKTNYKQNILLFLSVFYSSVYLVIAFMNPSLKDSTLSPLQSNLFIYFIAGGMIGFMLSFYYVFYWLSINKRIGNLVISIFISLFAMAFTLVISTLILSLGYSVIYTLIIKESITFSINWDLVPFFTIIIISSIIAIIIGLYLLIVSIIQEIHDKD